MTNTTSHRHLLALACLLAAGVSQAAHADDGWTGCYIGANTGYGWADIKSTEKYDVIADTYLNNNVGSDTATGGTFGAQLGCDLQSGAWVFGAQLAMDIADMDGSHLYRNGSSPADRFHHSVNNLTTLTARTGYLFQPELLLYGKAGAAWTDTNHKNADPLAPYTGDTSITRQGWLIGAGAEYKIQPHLSIFAEYSYMDFGSKNTHINYTDGDIFNFSFKQQMDYLSVGVNYRF